MPNAPTPEQEKQVMAALDAMVTANIKGDVTALTKIYHDDLAFSHSTGKKQTKAQVLTDVTNGKSRWVSVKFNDVDIKIYGVVAIVHTTTDHVIAQPAGNKSNHLNQVWALVKEPQGWQVAVRHTTSIKPPAA